MNKRRLFKAASCAAAFAPLFFASCVDDSYDLSKDIDMTVTIGGNLSIPSSGTEEFSLDDIMDLEYKENPEDSVIRTDADGNYRFLKEESSDPTDVEIEPVIIDEPECDETITTLNFDTPTDVSGEVEAQVEDVEMSFTFTKDDVTTDVTEVSAADVDFEAYLTLSFEPISHNVDEITLKSGFTIEMQMEGQTQADNMVYELTDLNNYRVKDGAPQTIEFINDQTVRAGETLRVPVRFLRIQNFPEGAIVSMPLRSEGNSRSRAFAIGALSGVVEPAGAALTILLAAYVTPFLPYLLAFAAGAMIYVVVEELIPEASQGRHSNLGTIGFAAGFSLMMVLDVALG